MSQIRKVKFATLYTTLLHLFKRSDASGLALGATVTGSYGGPPVSLYDAFAIGGVAVPLAVVVPTAGQAPGPRAGR
ncbi:hypothetical protein C7I84_02155 [Mesorhizobium ephedrae]|uniref:Uncharacterized protein n=1 Tax=Kumtagia ephedrae TaxID=2116701 RepID=A0A2P7SRS2_9HYPH|nr:hypothetical protein C7I84_02155 [Mesorhizobium ephedrae]